VELYLKAVKIKVKSGVKGAVGALIEVGSIKIKR
jgi:hypothetical protein